MNKLIMLGALSALVFSAASAAQQPPAAAAATPPPLEIGYCIDTTASVGSALVGPGKALLERHLAALVRPGFPGLRLHLRKIGRDSWGPGAELVTAQISAVPREPAAPHKSPFTPAVVWNSKQAAYRRARAVVDRAQRTAQAQLHAILRQVDRTPLPVEYGTDVTGCAAAFGTLWAAMPGPHSLTILSDLAPEGRNTSATVRFSGQTAVTVVLYCADQADAAACEARGTAFGRQMRRAGATSYHVYDSADVAFVPLPH